MAPIATVSSGIPIPSNANTMKTPTRSGSAQGTGGSPHNPGAQGKPAPTTAQNPKNKAQAEIQSGFELMKEGIELLQAELGDLHPGVVLLE